MLYSIDGALKLNLRLSLFNTPVIPTVEMFEGDFIDKEDDIGEFTDGCGFISPKLAKQIYQQVKEYEKITFQSSENTEYDEQVDYAVLDEDYVPTAFQIRFMGAKGMVFQKADLKADLVLRSSMIKIKYKSISDLDPVLRTLQVVDYSSPCDFARLNSTIHMVSGCAKEGQEDELYDSLQKIADQHVEKLYAKYLTENTVSIIKAYLQDSDFASLNILASTGIKELAFLTGPFKNQIQSMVMVVNNARRCTE